ncbi:MAG: MFS transporter [Veillonellales bacterium]
MENRQSFYGWKLVGALWFLYLLNMGFPLYGGAVINTYTMKELAMDRSTFGLGFTLLNFFVGVPSMIIAAAIVRWGIKATFGIGSTFICVGALWMTFVASQPWHYLVGFGVLIGTGIGFGTIVPLSTAVTRWFKRYRGRAMALAMTASGFAGFIGAPLMNKILASNGGDWRQAWLIVAGIAVVGAIIAFLFVKERPEDSGQIVDGEPEPAPSMQGTSSALSTKYPWTPGEAYGTRAFWMIVVGSIASQFPFFFFTAHWIMHLKGVGITAADAALAMGLFTMGGIAGRLIGGWLMDKMAARFAFMLGICCYFIGSFLAIGITASTLTVAFVAAILYGAGFGWSFVCLNTMVGNYYGPAAFPKVNGMVLLISAIACSPAGIVGGKLFDMFKNYTPAFELNVGICVVGVIALIFATMPQQPKDVKAAKGANV